MAREAAPLDERDQAILEAVAKRVVELRMEVPAILTLESVKPLSLLGSQAMFFFEPFVAALLNVPNYRRFGELIERRDNVERLIRLIEERAEAARRAARQAAPPGGGPATRA
jgi:hypothetical protein